MADTRPWGESSPWMGEILRYRPSVPSPGVWGTCPPGVEVRLPAEALSPRGSDDDAEFFLSERFLEELLEAVRTARAAVERALPSVRAPLRFVCGYRELGGARCASPAPRWWYDRGGDDGPLSLCQSHAAAYVRHGHVVHPWHDLEHARKDALG
jgi:hypothetical protein